MMFRLKYDGVLLPDNQRGVSTKDNKHAIRKCIHKQIAPLWDLNPALKSLKDSKHYSGPNESRMFDWLAENYSRCGFRFIPLVHQHWKLLCDIDILFLRRDDPGKLIKSGDIDNRIKTLFDALRIPQQCSELPDDLEPKQDEDPFYCLLEDDSLITGFRVTTDRLLTPETNRNDDVSLLMTIKVMPSQIGIGTVAFLA